MAMTFVAHAQYELHVPYNYSLIANSNLDFDDLTVAVLAPPIIWSRTFVGGLRVRRHVLVGTLYCVHVYTGA